jgi:type I restriction enzyme M protein
MKRGSGRCAILFPHGVLFRNEERTMRERIVANDVIDCVLGLGPNLFYNSPMEACVVVCRTDKPEERRGKILFVNAVNEVTREQAQSFLTDEHIQRIVDTYRAFEDVPDFAYVATNDNVLQKDGNLSIPLYVRSKNVSTNGRDSGNTATLQQAIVEWQRSSASLRETMRELFEVLGQRTKDKGETQ